MVASRPNCELRCLMSALGGVAALIKQDTLAQPQSSHLWYGNSEHDLSFQDCLRVTTRIIYMKHLEHLRSATEMLTLFLLLTIIIILLWRFHFRITTPK